MFHQYSQMAHRIRKHYLSPRVLLCLLTGQFVPPINRKNLYSLQYSMLPARRATVWEMWRALNMELPQRRHSRCPPSRRCPTAGEEARQGGRGRTTECCNCLDYTPVATSKEQIMKETLKHSRGDSAGGDSVLRCW